MPRELKRPGRMRVGGGAAFANDRLDAALALVERGDVDVLMLDALAERTLAMLHVAHRAGRPGYWEALPARLRHLLPACRRAGAKASRLSPTAAAWTRMRRRAWCRRSRGSAAWGGFV